MLSSNHTLAFLLTLLLHAAGLLIIASGLKPPREITLAVLELTSVELNLTDATEDSQPSPPPTPIAEPAAPEAPPPPEPLPPAPPEPQPPPPPMTEPEPILLPELKPPPPAAAEPEPAAPQPSPPEVPPQPLPQPAKIPDPPLPATQPLAPKEPAPAPELPESTTPESGVASAQMDAPPRPRRTIKPAYPAGARRRGEEGAVTLNVKISAAGRAVDVTVTRSSGFPELDQAARQAVQKAQFTPAMNGTRAVDSSAGLTIIFKLR